MRAELPVFSFLSACILLVALPFKRVRRDIPSTCLLLWLLAWNVIHAVNAVMWAGNADVRALPWCDLVTKVMLAALMGVAGCALCMLRVLEFLASARNPGPNARRNTVSIEVLFCIVIPVLYMVLHFIVQDQRFAIAADIGCVASIHPSSPSLILMWLPPAIECVAAFALFCIAVHHVTRVPSTLLDEHLSTRTPISSGLLLRNLCFASTACSLVVIAVLFGVFSPTVVTWGSWAAVHSHMRRVSVIHGSEAQAAEVMWWIVPVVTFLWLLCFVAFGSERREVVESVRGRVQGVFSRSQPPSARPESTISFFHASEHPSLKSKCSDLSCSMKGVFVRAPKPPKPAQTKSGKPARAKSAQTLSMICEDIVGIPFSDRDRQSPRSTSTTFVDPLVDPSPVPSSRFSVATSAVGSDTDGPSGWKKIKESLRLPEQRPRAPAIVVPLSIRPDSEARDSTQLRSGWDDMLDGGRKSPMWNLKKIVIQSKGGVLNGKSGVQDGKSGSPTTSSSSDDSDAAFRENTMEYMQSPVARSLGLTSPTRGLTSPTYGSASPPYVLKSPTYGLTSPPIVSPPPAYSSPPRRGVLERPPSCTPPRPPPVPLGPAQRMSAPIDSVLSDLADRADLTDRTQADSSAGRADLHDRQRSDSALILLRDPPKSQSIPEDAKSTISSICRAPWPEPPCSPPPIPLYSSTPIASNVAPKTSGAPPMVLSSVPTRSSSMPMDISSVQNSSTALPPSPHSRDSSGVFGQAF
ncbi:pheromone A receptor-domain-containing protein [Schizophyllum commune]